jgi:hypothetical protein
VSDLIQLMGWIGLDSAPSSHVALHCIINITNKNGAGRNRTESMCLLRPWRRDCSVSNFGAFQRVRGISTMTTRVEPRIIFLLYYRLRLSFSRFPFGSLVIFFFEAIGPVQDIDRVQQLPVCRSPSRISTYRATVGFDRRNSGQFWDSALS